MLCKLDEQIEKKTIDEKVVGGYESRSPYQPSNMT